MLGIILKILVLLGWLLLFVTILLLSLLLLVAIYPISYRIWWEKNAEHMSVKAKASWLAGVLNVRFEYPAPGNVVVKLFGITVYDSGKAKEEPGKKKSKAKKTATVGTDAGHENSADGSDATRADIGDDTNVKQGEISSGCDVMRGDMNSGTDTERNDTDKTETVSAAFDADNDGGLKARICNTIEKIKTKVKQIIENIKNIRELAAYYIKILKEEDTNQLLSKIFTGSGKLLKCIRPRKIKGQILLGTGSPDTTGYAMAVYGILSPYLGQNLVLTPDFEDKVFKGRLFVKGRIIVGILLIHASKIALDRRFHLFLKKLKREVI